MDSSGRCVVFAGTANGGEIARCGSMMRFRSFIKAYDARAVCCKESSKLGWGFKIVGIWVVGDDEVV